MKLKMYCNVVEVINTDLMFLTTSFLSVTVQGFWSENRTRYSADVSQHSPITGWLRPPSTDTNATLAVCPTPLNNKYSTYNVQSRGSRYEIRT